MRTFPAKFLLFFCLTSGSALANDGAASTAAGGIQLGRETRIAMRTEKLTISREKITVEYEFVNDTDQDITTEVAFPIPPYTFEFDDPGGPRGFSDLEVSVNGVQIKCGKEVKASVAGTDVTSELKKLGIDADSFGHFDFVHEPDPQSPEIARLPRADRQRLSASGIIDSKTAFPRWAVSKTYYWQQTFPAHSMIHIRHQYKPVAGFTPIQLASQGSDSPNLTQTSALPAQWTMSKETSQVLANACVTPELQDRLTSSARMNKGWTEAYWIDYILTTANTWKTPISDFQLIVERPQDDEIGGVRRHWYLSLCWDAGPVRRLDKDHFEVSATDFVPPRELHVAFFADSH